VGDPLPFDPIEEARRQWQRHWGDAATPSMVAVTSIMRTQQILLARLNELLAPWELTFPRYEALMLLYYSRRGSLPLGKMGERLQVHRTSITNVVDGLERLGLAVREAHDAGDDHRPRPRGRGGRHPSTQRRPLRDRPADARGPGRHRRHAAPDPARRGRFHGVGAKYVVFLQSMFLVTGG
jgi:hypothetical protein